MSPGSAQNSQRRFAPLRDHRLDRHPPISDSWSASCHAHDMIAPTRARRKGSFSRRAGTDCEMPDLKAKRGVTRSLAESQYRPTSVNRLPRWLGKRRYCVGPVLSVSDSSAPSPPGSSGPDLTQHPTLGQRELVLFVFVGYVAFVIAVARQRQIPKFGRAPDRTFRNDVSDFSKNSVQQRIRR